MVAPEQLPLFPAEKRCPGCGKACPLSAFYLHKGRKGGLSTMCKDCTRAERRAWRAAHPERVRATLRRYRASHRAELIAANRAWWEANKEWWNARRRAEYANNPELRRQASKRWRRANPEKVRLKQRARYLQQRAVRLQGNRVYRSTHRDVVNACNRRSYNRQFQADPDKFRLRVQKRRALRRTAEGSHTGAELDMIVVAQRGMCAYCGIELTKRKHVDHMQPLSKGGSDWAWNLCVTCVSCNARKGDQSAGQFFARLLKEKRAHAAV